MQGLLSLFYLAMLTNRAFLIHWEGPGNLIDYLEPNQIDWSVPLDDIGTFEKMYWGCCARPPGYSTIREESRGSFRNWINETNFDGYFIRLVAVGTMWNHAETLRNNPFLSERARHLEIPTLTSKMYGCAFHFLFQQSRTMKKVLIDARESLSRGTPLLGLHIRTNDFQYGKFGPNSIRSSNTSSFFLCALRLRKVIRENIRTATVTNLKWFLATDDQVVKNMASVKYPNETVTLNFKPRHLEYEKGPNKETILLDVLTDLFLLAESNFLLITRRSSLSRLAVAVGFHEKETSSDAEQCVVNETSFVRTIASFFTSG